MTTQLPVRPETRGKVTDGFCTPKEDKHPQRVSVPPGKVLPIVFLPGIMGSNLRMSAARQSDLHKNNNIAWRPDRLVETLGMVSDDAATRQSRLDPDETEVDTYDEGSSPTGDKSEKSDTRHDTGKLWVPLHLSIDTPLLIDDPLTAKHRKSKEEKARDRGWGEIYFSSYRAILETCETLLNRTVINWERIVGIAPSEWHAHHTPHLAPLTQAELVKATEGCWFPVHAMGYNWLKASGAAAMDLRKRILELIDRYCTQGYQCEKVIIVTHSMGGLVARALIHPSMGNMEEKILGVVHGVMPAMGAPAAYKRMRCGFEEELYGMDPAPKVLGNYGTEVTAVLANSPGALELLPSEAYGNGWLQIKQNGGLLASFPKHGDPYEEIYKVRGKWYGLLREEWINPAGQAESNFGRTCDYLDMAKQFHRDIGSTFHSTSFAHYGADKKRPSWQYVIWDIKAKHEVTGWQNFEIHVDDRQGKFALRPPTAASEPFDITHAVSLGPCLGPGDQTVPLASADQQMQSGKFKGIFRQIGYEHQHSYSNAAALHSTLFSLVRIIQTMSWAPK